jgi:exonuclease V gamma subunit
MALYVFFSNHLESLADSAIEKLDADWKDPFHPPELIVPSAQTFGWLQARILKRYAVDALLSPRYLDAFLREELFKAKADSQTVKNPTSVSLLQLHLMRLLQHGNHPWLTGPTGAGSQRPIPDRLLQMSESLSRLFLEYFSSRLDLVKAWENNRDFFTNEKGPSEKHDEQFQRELYRELRKQDGFRTIAHEMRELLYTGSLEKLKNSSGSTAPSEGPVYLFNMTGLGLVYYDLLAKISQARDLFAFVLNPCAAFWEDVVTVRQRRGRERKLLRSFGALRDKDLTVQDMAENPLLRSWGDYGKHIVKAWSERAADYANTQYAECPAIPPAGEGTLLQNIQNAMLYRMPGKPAPAGDEKQNSDGSLALYACKGRLRQIEILRDWIWEQIGNQKISGPLPLDQIGIYFSDLNAYASEISMVFDAWPAWHELHIPWNLEEKNAGISQFGSALRAYLAVMEGPFTRPQVLAFISNPLVMEKLKITGSDIFVFRKWIRELNIFRGYNADHRELIDSRPESSHTWEQGIDRLILGVIAGGVTRLGDREYLPYRDIDTGDDSLVCNFIGMIQKLWNDRSALLSELCAANGWEAATVCLQKNIREWVAPADRTENGVMETFLKSLREVQGQGAQCPESTSFSDSSQGLALFIRWVKSLIPSPLRARTGGGGALSFRNLKPGNVFPARICALVGFGADEFPGARFGDSLDLRQYKPQADDADAIMKNQHAFLEAVAGARERLAIFYPALDPVSGQETAPSSTVLELLSATGLSLKHFRIDTPLLAEEGFCSVAANAGNDSSIVARNPFPVMAPLLRAAEHPSLAFSAKTAFRDEAPVEPLHGAKRHRVKLGALKRWLEDPFSQRIRQALGRDDTAESLENISDEEPFETAFLDSLMLVREVVDTALREFAGSKDSGDIAKMLALTDGERRKRNEGYFDKAYRKRVLKGETPEGFFGSMDKRKLLNDITLLLDHLRDALGRIGEIQSTEFIAPRRLSMEPKTRNPGLVLQDIPVKGESVLLEAPPLSGFWTKPQIGKSDPCLHFFVPLYPTPKNETGLNKMKYALLPWLMGKALAAGNKSDFTLAIHLLGGDQEYQFSVDIRSEKAAKDLRLLLCDYMAQSAIEHLPLQAIECLIREGNDPEKLTPEDISAWLEEDFEKGTFAAYRHGDPFVDLLEPQISPDAQSVIQKRFGELAKMCYPAPDLQEDEIKNV